MTALLLVEVKAPVQHTDDPSGKATPKFVS